MKVSIKSILLFTAAIAVVAAFALHKTPVELLRARGAGFGKQNTGDLYLLAFESHWSEYGYIDEGVTNIEDVELVSFSQNAELSEADFRNFKKFPNLAWLCHLKDCPKLTVLCLAKTSDEREVVDCLKSMHALRFASVSGNRIIVDSEW